VSQQSEPVPVPSAGFSNVGQATLIGTEAEESAAKEKATPELHAETINMQDQEEEEVEGEPDAQEESTEEAEEQPKVVEAEERLPLQQAVDDAETADSAATNPRGDTDRTGTKPQDDISSAYTPLSAEERGVPDSDGEGGCERLLNSDLPSCHACMTELLKWRHAVSAEASELAEGIHCVAAVLDGDAMASIRPLITGRTAKSSSSRWRSENGHAERQEPPLEVSSSSWVAQQRSWHKTQHQHGDGTDQQIGDATITRHIRSILNKLTIERFDPLLVQLCSCGISTQGHLQILMHEIMEKATTQHHFIPMYTDLCVVLQDWCTANQIGDSSQGSFKRILVTQCQTSFERYLKPPEYLKELQGEDRDEAEVKYKTAMLGNIRFVGALLGKNMVGSQVILAITNALLAKPIVPEALECLAAFLTAVGSMFDGRQDWKHRKELNNVFAELDRISQDTEKVPARIRCLFSDVLDLRRAGWKDKKQATKDADGPMTLQEVHLRAEQCTGPRAADRAHGGRKQHSGGGWGSGGQDTARWPQQPPLGGSKGSKGGGGGGKGWAVTPNAHARGALARSADQALLQPVAHASSQDQGAAVQSSASDMEKSAERVVGQHDEAKKIKNGVRAAVKELCVLHDIPEAIQRLREMAIPAEYQAGELAHILAQVAEEGNQGSRSVCFNFVVQLFVDCVFSKSELQPGLDRFFFQELR